MKRLNELQKIAIGRKLFEFEPYYFNEMPDFAAECLTDDTELLIADLIEWFLVDNRQEEDDPEFLDLIKSIRRIAYSN